MKKCVRFIMGILFLVLPEASVEIWDYLDSRITPLSAGQGLQMVQYDVQTLAAIENRFGVEAKVLLAIWSMESAYGAVFDKPERLHYVPQALATLAYAVDMDGNGRRDIWNSVPDALATATNLLHSNGWQSGKTWGYEVILPAGGERCWTNEILILCSDLFLLFSPYTCAQVEKIHPGLSEEK